MGVNVGFVSHSSHPAEQNWLPFEHEHILEEGGCIDRGTDNELAQLDENVHFVNKRVRKFAADWQAKLLLPTKISQSAFGTACFAQMTVHRNAARLSHQACPWCAQQRAQCFTPDLVC